MIVKVKEPLPSEFAYLRPGLILFTYLHLAADEELTRALVAQRRHRHRLRDGADSPTASAAAPADERGRRTHVDAGRRRTIWRRPEGGRGMLLGGVPGVRPAHVVILGGGIGRHQRRADRAGHGRAGHAARHQPRPPPLPRRSAARSAVDRRYSTTPNIAESLRSADAADRRGAGARRAAPRLVTREMLALMPYGA